MKKHNSILRGLKVLLGSAGLLVATINGSAFATPSASMSLSPANTAVTQSSSTVLTIQIKAGSQKISGAQACIRFNPDELTLINIDTTASPLTYATPSSSADCSSGEVQVGRFGVSYPSGTFTLAQLTFKALSPTASSTVSFDSVKSFVKDNSTTDSNGTYISILTSTSGATIKQSAIPAGEASPNPSSPEKNPTNSPALTDAMHNGQATSNDVKIGKNAAIYPNAPRVPETPSTRRIFLTFGAGTLTIIIATLLLTKFIGVPGKTPIKNHKHESKKERS